MSLRWLLISVIFILGLSSTAFSQQTNQEVNDAPNAPKDRPVNTNSTETAKLEQAVKPYIEKARKTYPEAKERFLNGLPPKNTFFITTRLHDNQGRFEQVFIAVRTIKDGNVSGLISSQLQLVSGYKSGESYTFPEAELIDWTISKPDGTEEGNFVGKFLDTYQPEPVVENSKWRSAPATPERLNQTIEEAAIRYQANAPIPRAIFYDIGYPNTDEEYAALDGNAVILLTTVVQEREELPLTRVYVSTAGKEIELKLIKLVLSEQSPTNKTTANTFGRFRGDALYLLPVGLRMKNADLVADFAKNKIGFKVATFGTPVPIRVSSLAVKTLAGTGPNEKALQDFIKREYPSFFKE